jgi:hypothetical protein
MLQTGSLDLARKKVVTKITGFVWYVLKRFAEGIQVVIWRNMLVVMLIKLVLLFPQELWKAGVMAVIGSLVVLMIKRIGSWFKN